MAMKSLSEFIYCYKMQDFERSLLAMPS